MNTGQSNFKRSAPQEEDDNRAQKRLNEDPSGSQPRSIHSILERYNREQLSHDKFEERQAVGSDVSSFLLKFNTNYPADENRNITIPEVVLQRFINKVNAITHDLHAHNTYMQQLLSVAEYTGVQPAHLSF